MFDCLVVGAGFAGAVFAREMAEIGKRVLLVEKRKHIGGNCYDQFDDHGVLIHTYGPHLFHTSNETVFHYLSRFTEWRDYQHRVLADVDGQKIPLPFNLNSLRMVFPEKMATSLEERLIQTFGYDVKVPILELKKTADKELQYLADFVYEKIFVNYTAKQWGCLPEEIGEEVMSRVPVFISRDDRYFQDRYQAVPKQGYTRLFDNLLDHPNIHLLLNTDYNNIFSLHSDSYEMELFEQVFTGDVIFTGMIDELFDFRFGELPYRSLQFQFDHLKQDFFQQASVENYPNNYDFTRITEFKRISGQQVKNTTILREYPHAYDRNDITRNVPCYPIFQDENVELFKKYESHASKIPRLTLAGRLAEYRYYDMDDIVEQALAVFKEKFNY